MCYVVFIIFLCWCDLYFFLNVIFSFFLLFPFSLFLLFPFHSSFSTFFSAPHTLLLASMNPPHTCCLAPQVGYTQSPAGTSPGSAWASVAAAGSSSGGSSQHQTAWRPPPGWVVSPAVAAPQHTAGRALRGRGHARAGSAAGLSPRPGGNTSLVPGGVERSPGALSSGGHACCCPSPSQPGPVMDRSPWLGAGHLPLA